MLRRIWCFLLCVIVAVGFAQGCGGEDSGTDGDNPPSQESEPPGSVEPPPLDEG
jgi:hypothetical protein